MQKINEIKNHGTSLQLLCAFLLSLVCSFEMDAGAHFFLRGRLRHFKRNALPRGPGPQPAALRRGKEAMNLTWPSGDAVRPTRITRSHERNDKRRAREGP